MLLHVSPKRRQVDAYGVYACLLVLSILLDTGESQSYTTISFNISGASAAWNTSTVQSSLSQVSSISLTETSAVAVIVETCPAGTFSVVNSQTCSACPQGKYSSTTSASSPDSCLSCESGKYSNATGASSSATCLSCPVNTYFTGTGGPKLTVCTSCPVNSESYEASKLLESCICSPGYMGPNGIVFLALW
jgi:hypothetical protein